MQTIDMRSIISTKPILITRRSLLILIRVSAPARLRRINELNYKIVLYKHLHRGPGYKVVLHKYLRRGPGYKVVLHKHLYRGPRHKVVLYKHLQTATMRTMDMRSITKPMLTTRRSFLTLIRVSAPVRLRRIDELSYKIVLYKYLYRGPGYMVVFYKHLRHGSNHNYPFYNNRIMLSGPRRRAVIDSR